LIFKEDLMKITNRFLNYVSYPTMSDETSETVPSSKKQLVLSRAIADELIAIGLTEVELDECGYLYATLPANGILELQPFEAIVFEV